MYKNTNCFHLAIPCGDLEKAKHFYNEILGCRLDNSAQEWADVDFWGNELTLHASEHKLESERHDGDILDAVQQADFERYIQAGGGFVGVHAATDTEYEWL